MKTAEEILENIMCCTIEEDADLDVKSNYYYQHDDVVKAIEQAQKEAYNQALEDATKKAKVSLFDWIDSSFKEFKQNSNHYSINDGTYVKIDEQSILKLKK